MPDSGDPVIERQCYTPTELNREVRLHIEGGFPRILLEGEISNLSRPASGHLYFSLKDDRAQVRCALFRSAATRLSFRPDNGMQVVARGRLSLYEARGEFQMIVDGLRDAGEGALRRQFEALKQRLEREGLFDAGRKRPLPGFPGRIEVITSASGAAVRDILHVLERRWPVARIRLRAVPVQGTDAAPAIVGALRAANRVAWADVIIVGRGGGSLEDLWAFNEESVARAIADSAIPVISAVGHETDASISDFVADVRAPTPSAAAEIASPDAAELRAAFDRLGRQITRRTDNTLQQRSQRLDHLAHRLGQQHPRARLADRQARLDAANGAVSRTMRHRIGSLQRATAALAAAVRTAGPAERIRQRRERVARLHHALHQAGSHRVDAARSSVGTLARTLQAVSPLQTIGRGYAVLLDEHGADVVTSVRQLDVEQRVTAQLADGRATCVVEATSDETL